MDRRRQLGALGERLAADHLARAGYRVLERNYRTARGELDLIALVRVREHEQITNREYRQLAGVSESTALRDLETLVERGSLQRVGKRRGRHYRLP